MKRFKTALICLLIYSIAIPALQLAAATWHSTNQATVAWDAVTTNVDGNAIDPAEVSYEVFIREDGTTTEISLGVTTLTSMTVTMPHEGKFYVGVKSIRTVNGAVAGESVVAWSNDPLYDFGIQYFAAPSEPSGLRMGN